MTTLPFVDLFLIHLAGNSAYTCSSHFKKHQSSTLDFLKQRIYCEIGLLGRERNPSYFQFIKWYMIEQTSCFGRGREETIRKNYSVSFRTVVLYLYLKLNLVWPVFHLIILVNPETDIWWVTNFCFSKLWKRVFKTFSTDHEVKISKKFFSFAKGIFTSQVPSRHVSKLLMSQNIK